VKQMDEESYVMIYLKSSWNTIRTTKRRQDAEGAASFGGQKYLYVSREKTSVHLEDKSIIKTDIKEIRCQSANWIPLQLRIERRVLVKAICWFPQNSGHFVNRWATISYTVSDCFMAIYDKPCPHSVNATDMHHTVVTGYLSITSSLSS
jgi:hypothetical protein